MFETAELGLKVSKEEFDAAAGPLRLELVEVQQALRAAPFPVIVVFAGVDGAGKGESANLICEWMDPRWIKTRAYGEPSDEERERPPFWRFWRDLPPRGTIGLFLTSWYTLPLHGRVYGGLGKEQLDAELDRIVAFERALTDDGALIVKLWMHLGRKQQRKRFKALEKDPLQAWRVTAQDWKNLKRHEDFTNAAERIIRRTSVGSAPWTIIEGADEQYRSLTVLTTVRDAVRRHLAAIRAQEPAPAEAPPTTPEPSTRPRRALASLDLSLALTKGDYEQQLKEERARLNLLFRKARRKGRSTVIAFEGWDAAGKGGAIRRLTPAFDARDVQVLPIAAPTDEERARHYLWRFWRHLSRAGRVTIFDRSWYGRVLVERVEGFATGDEWRRAYAEINDFEQQLVSHGVVLVKLWLHISKDEQERRFRERGETPFKRWKLTDEDWRNRERWDDYERAVDDMVEQTSTATAPWTLVEANDKRHGRIKVIRTVCDRMETALGE
ncbi:MAG: hypothetical protein AMXMBFR64_11730 [Myxococcales bacterium]